MAQNSVPQRRLLRAVARPGPQKKKPQFKLPPPRAKAPDAVASVFTALLVHLGVLKAQTLAVPVWYTQNTQPHNGRYFT
ncbi:hypothetical protein ACVGWV_01930, partial [Enterobacter asburiae]